MGNRIELGSREEILRRQKVRHYAERYRADFAAEWGEEFIAPEDEWKFRAWAERAVKLEEKGESAPRFKTRDPKSKRRRKGKIIKFPGV